MKSRGMFLFLFPLCSFLAFFNQAYAETLQQAVSRTVETNPEILAAARHKLSSDQAIDVAKGKFLPTLDINAGIGLEKAENINTRSSPGTTGTLTHKEAGLQANQEIFTGYSTVHDVARTRFGAQSAAFQLDATAENVSFAVVQAYLDVLRQQELVRLAEQNLSAHTRTFGMIHRRSKSGITKEADSVHAGGRVALSKANLEAARGNLNEAKIRFTRITGHVPEKLEYPKFNSKYFPATRDEAILIGIRNNPTLHAAIADYQAASAQHKLTQAANYPQVSAHIEVDRDNDIGGVKGVNNDTLGIIRVSYNLYNGGSDMARQRESAYLVQEAAEERNRVRREVQERIGLAWTAVEVNENLVKQYENHRASVGRTVEAYREQFKLGERTLLDFLDSENEYYSAGVAVVNAKIDALIAKYQLLAAMGVLLDSVDVVRPSKRFVKANTEVPVFRATNRTYK